MNLVKGAESARSDEGWYDAQVVTRERLATLAKQIRIDSLKMVHRAKASHIGSALSCADILAVLYNGFMKVKGNNRSRFIMSKGHATVALYAALKHSGHDIDLETYGQNNSNLMHHASHKVPGVEFSTGSLGHGLPFGVGKALASKRKKEHWPTRVLVSDGELQEGSNWEAIMFAAHHKLANLTMIVDYNNLQSITTVEKTLDIGPLANKLQSFGWKVRVVDGHNQQQIFRGLVQLMPTKRDEPPAALICKTIKGKGVSFMENKVEWHYKYPNDEQLAQAIAEVQGA
jgi:transketolase